VAILAKDYVRLDGPRAEVRDEKPSLEFHFSVNVYLELGISNTYPRI
jgi:hypothetical protein